MSIISYLKFIPWFPNIYTHIIHIQHDTTKHFHYNIAYALCATNKYFQVLGNIHDVEAYTFIDNVPNLNSIIFTSHWAHLTIISVWCASSCYHVGWQGNYEFWLANPVKIMPIIHSIFDPHLSSYDPESDVAYSGLYNLFLTLGYTCTMEIYKTIIYLQCAALVILLLSFIYSVFIDVLIFYMLPRLISIIFYSPLNTANYIQI